MADIMEDSRGSADADGAWMADSTEENSGEDADATGLGLADLLEENTKGGVEDGDGACDTGDGMKTDDGVMPASREPSAIVVDGSITTCREEGEGCCEEGAFEGGGAVMTVDEGAMMMADVMSRKGEDGSLISADGDILVCTGAWAGEVTGLDETVIVDVCAGV